MSKDYKLLYATCIVLVTILMNGCEQRENPQVRKVLNINKDESIREVDYDGCQYLLYDGYKSGGLTHKANCTNH